MDKWNPEECYNCGEKLWDTKNNLGVTLIPQYSQDGEPKERIGLCSKCILGITRAVLSNEMLFAELPIESLKDIKKGLEWINKSKVKQSDEVYYEIMTTGDGDKQGPVYLWIIQGDHMLQSSIYDATKFTTRELAEKRIEIIKNIFTYRDFNIVQIDKRIFGDTPRNVMNYEAGYISKVELDSYGEFTKNQKKIIKSMYGEYPKGFFKEPRCALLGYF